MKSIFVKNISLYLFIVCCLGSLLASINVQASTKHSDHREHNLMGSHGMVLIYHPEEGFFVSHLPLYSSPHNYQIIYQVKVNKPQKLVEMIDKGMVTLLPSNFDLRRLISGQHFAIKTQVFQGHFERGGKVEFSTDITFVKPILTEKVSPSFTSPAAIYYQVAISEKHTIFAHKIQQAPSFDVIGFVKQAKTGSELTIKKCEQPSVINEQMIKESIAACADFRVQYIEVQDFK